MNHKIVTYPAIFKPLGDNIYVVNFPDIKGALTEGKGLEEAIKMAADTLASRLYNRKSLPQASKKEDIKLADDGSIVVNISADLTEASQNHFGFSI